MKKQRKELLNLICSDYKESETIIKIIPFIYLMAVLFFLFKQILIAWGFLLILIGSLLNWFVIGVNKGSMPISVKNRIEFNEALEKSPNRTMCMVTKKTKFSWLSDRFYLFKKWMSLGDFVIDMGSILLIFYIIKL